MRTIFLGGIHGAGKTRLAANVERQMGIIRHFSAGALLTSSHVEREATDRDFANSFEGNQHAIIDQLRNRTAPAELVLLDGHFAVFAGSDVIPVPAEYFGLLNPVVLLLLDTSARQAQHQLLLRDGHAPPVALLQALRGRELSNARIVSETLSVPLRILRGRDVHAQAVTLISAVIDEL